MNKHVEYLRCDFTDAEIAETAKQLARANYKRTSLEQQKKEVDSALKGEIEAENSVIQRLSNCINTGHEYRNIECRIELDTPEPGKKRVVRLDTGEEVSVRLMTDADRQMVLDLQARADAEAAAAAPVEKVYEMPGAPVLRLPQGIVAEGDAAFTMTAAEPRKRETEDRNNGTI